MSESRTPMYDLDRDASDLGDFYTAHVDAMTREKLHAKSDIAAELAFRDQRIERLELALAEAEELLSTVINSNDIGGAWFERTEAALATIQELRERRAMTKEEFKARWESNDTGGGITFEDIANCAQAWGLFRTPRIHQIDHVRHRVLKAANCVDADEFAPEESHE